MTDAATEMRAELQRLAGAPSPDAARRLHLPRLYEATGVASGDVDGLLAALERVATGFHDPAMTAAAGVIFYDADRWSQPKLGRRQDRAGAAMGVNSQSGWTRRRRDGSPSHHDRLLDLLVTGLGAAGVPAPDGTPATQPPPGNEGATRRHRVLTAVVVLALVAAAAFVVVRSGRRVDAVAAPLSPSAPAVPATDPGRGASVGGESASAAPSETVEVTARPWAVTTATTEEPATTGSVPVSTSVPCVVPAGTPAATLSPAHRELLAASATAFAEVAGDACGAGPVYEFGVGVIQDLVVDGAEDGVVVMAPGHAPVRLSWVQWANYREAASRNEGATTLELGGIPIAVTDADVSPSMIELSAGGVLVGRTSAGPYFWVPHLLDARARWERSGGPTGELGLPMSNPFPGPTPAGTVPWYQEGWYLEFEHGYLTAAKDMNEESVRLELVTDRRAPVAGLDLSERIVTQLGSQAWFIDAAGHAHWIPDIPTWDCLGGQSRLVAENVPGYTIASFAPLGVATCDLLRG